MTGRIEGAELCHRIDAAKQLVKYGSKDAAEFIAKYKGVPCGHSINGRPDPADPCSGPERSLVAVTLNAPPTLTRDFLTVLSGIDEFLMARLIRAQTADGVTVIEFLDDVMQDRTDGFKTHHRIAAAKELIVHIVRDEQPSHTPSPSTTPSPLTGEGWGEGDTPGRRGRPTCPPASRLPHPLSLNGRGLRVTPRVGADPRVRPLPGSHTPAPSTRETDQRGDSAAADPRVRPLPGSQTPSPRRERVGVRLPGAGDPDNTRRSRGGGDPANVSARFPEGTPIETPFDDKETARGVPCDCVGVHHDDGSTSSDQDTPADVVLRTRHGLSPSAQGGDSCSALPDGTDVGGLV